MTADPHSKLTAALFHHERTAEEKRRRRWNIFIYALGLSAFYLIGGCILAAALSILASF